MNRRFNSRSREGSDARCRQRQGQVGCFNSRSREGSDAGSAMWLCSTPGFNSRSREGSDKITREEAKQLLVSIRAPARGATLYC